VKIFNRSNPVNPSRLAHVLAVFGYTGPATTKPQICTIQQVASRAACEGPP